MGKHRRSISPVRSRLSVLAVSVPLGLAALAAPALAGTSPKTPAAPPAPSVTEGDRCISDGILDFTCTNFEFGDLDLLNDLLDVEDTADVSVE